MWFFVGWGWLLILVGCVNYKAKSKTVFEIRLKMSGVLSTKMNY